MHLIVDFVSDLLLSFNQMVLFLLMLQDKRSVGEVKIFSEAKSDRFYQANCRSSEDSS